MAYIIIYCIHYYRELISIGNIPAALQKMYYLTMLQIPLCNKNALKQ